MSDKQTATYRAMRKQGYPALHSYRRATGGLMPKDRDTLRLAFAICGLRQR